MSDIPTIINGREMKALMSFAAKSGKMSLPLFYNGNIYVTDGTQGVVTANYLINSLDKNKIYRPSKKAFDKVLVKNEYYFVGDRFAVSTKDDTEYFEMEDVTDIYHSLVSELNSLRNEKTREPPENHPIVLGVPSNQLNNITNYAATQGNPYVNSELRWQGEVPFYLYNFVGFMDKFMYICGVIQSENNNL